jgi:hypothetical protein
VKRRPGRPSVDPQGQPVYVGLTLASAQYDAFCTKAIRDSVSVPEVIRRTLSKKLKTPPR